ncbi:MAG: ABC transporter [Propionibacteriales bacterium]|nr:ABC transporter [Propionibacteriales bacterium]
MTAASPPTAASAPAPAGRTGTLGLALRQFDYWLTVYRRTWKGSAVSSFVMPLLYLTAMGVGLGGFIDDPDAIERLGGLTYLEYIAPGLLAATVMQNAVFESTYPVMSGIKWNKVFVAMLNTPVVVPALLLANFGYIAFRMTTIAGVFIVVTAVFGLVPSVWAGLLGLLVAVLIGLAHATPVVALSGRLENDAGFAIVFRLGVMPMFLFSGAFFPVSQLPAVFEWLAYVTPLWHGVELTRMLTTGTLEAGMAAVHTGYLLLWLMTGWWLAIKTFSRRLVQ